MRVRNLSEMGRTTLFAFKNLSLMLCHAELCAIFGVVVM